MTPDERKALAEQLDGNPLWHEILSEMEADAIERLIRASTEQDRVEAQWRVQSARTFREDCQGYLVSTPKRRGVPA